MANMIPIHWQNEIDQEHQSLINNFQLPFRESDASSPKENQLTPTWQDEKFHQADLPSYHEPTNPSELQMGLSQQPQTRFYQSQPRTEAHAIRSPLDPQVQVHLHDRQLWDSFSAAQTEMIVTKTGRRMFPGYRVKMSGMDPNAQYCVLMDISSVDENRYKFQHGEWVVAGRGEPQVPQRFYLHPNSPCSGQQWMKEIISFHKVKLTNSCGNSADGKFLIHSMHRYQPRIHIVRTDDVNTLHLQPMSTFAFPQTVFVTVTAYQNHEVTKLKINNNPFARGFRSNGGKTKNMLAQNQQCDLHVVESNIPQEYSRKRVQPSQLGDDLAQMAKRWHGSSPYHENIYKTQHPILSPAYSNTTQHHYNSTFQHPMPLNEISHNQPNNQYYQPYNHYSPPQAQYIESEHFDFRPAQSNMQASPVFSADSNSPTHTESHLELSVPTTTSPFYNQQLNLENVVSQTPTSFVPTTHPITTACGTVQVANCFRSPLDSTDEGYISTSLSNPDEEIKEVTDVISTLNDVLSTDVSPNNIGPANSNSAEINGDISCAINLLATSASFSPIY
uniref:T-box transcription factor Ci-Tbx6b n=1 Tax=Ciona intestinalis TaxID=7719 RepID=Q75UK2_CIOIN|nr:T-box transcription factor Ci-Tbx6b [Ciona intestinalis]BAD13501.1 T-box transcription factor Ci-Tbx6b [Ciona intestinalis]|eukprot:NP_001027752.1 T-box transcription factor Ci-Tbx6b [Ciona intestinalis]